MLHNFDHIKAYWMIQGLYVCQVALHFGADDMDGTHGSTDEERIYHSAGTHSGQYVDDREFRRLIEEAGYVPCVAIRRTKSFAYDWSRPTLRLRPTLSGSSLRSSQCYVPGVSSIRTICRFTPPSTRELCVFRARSSPTFPPHSTRCCSTGGSI